MPTATLLLLALMTLLCSMMLVSTMSLMPSNARFSRRVEYSDVMRQHLRRPLYLVTAFFYQVALLTTNIALVIQSVQTCDFAIAAVLGHSCLLPQVAPSLQAVSCPAAVTGGITVFADGTYGLPLGFFLTAVVVVPLGLLGLDDNIWVQKAAFVLLLAVCSVWGGLFAERGLHPSYVPAVGSVFAPVIGVSFANFAFLTSVPSWINEKKAEVSITASLSASLLLSVTVFILMGVLCALSFTPWSGSATLLDQVFSLATPLATVTFYAFPIVANLTSIPVNSIFSRGNYVAQGVHPALATFLSVPLPWLVAVPLYYGEGYLELALWSGVLVTSFVNFIAPPAVYLLALNERRRSDQLALEQRTRTAAADGDQEEDDQADLPEAHEDADSDSSNDPLWHVLPPRFQHLQVAMGVAVLTTMIAFSLLTLALTIAT